VIHHGRGYADDTSAGFLDQHLLNRKLSDIDEAFEVGGSERSEVLCRIVYEGLDEEYAGVVDKRVDRPELADRDVNDLCRGCSLAYISVDQRQLF
jgi:hypothetical protein